MRKAGLTVFVVLVVGLAVLVYGCNPWIKPKVERRPLPRLNPTSYVFAASISEVQGAIRKVKCCGMALEFGNRALFSGDLLKQPGSGNDAYLHNFHSPIGNSNVYVSKGRPLPYLAEFHLHLIPIDQSHTRVEIFTFKSEVIAGETWWGVHGTPANIYVGVTPTTVEEYRILREIGAALHTEGMPPLIQS